MNTISRRQLAKYAADLLMAGDSPRSVSRKLAVVLISSRRADEAEFLVDDIAYELEARGQLATAKVTSARRLSPGLRSQLLKAIKEAAKVEAAELEEVVDQTVLGGLRVETAAHSWDDTIARRLNDLKGVA